MNNFPSGAGSLVIALERGDYYLRISSGETTYSLVTTYLSSRAMNPDEDPGESLADAMALDILGSELIGGYVGAVDTADFYRFVLAQPVRDQPVF